MSVVVIGAGGHAREVVEALRTVDVDVRGHLVEAGYGQEGESVYGLPILGPLEWLLSNPGTEVICAVGDPALRLRLSGIAVRYRAVFRTVIHRSSVVAASVAVEPGVYIGAQCAVTASARLGSHAHINIGCTVSHDAEIGRFATLSPGVHLAGGVSVGEGALLGTGSVVLPGLSIGAWAVVGAGAVVIADVAADAVVVGVPAKVTEEQQGEWHRQR